MRRTLATVGFCLAAALALATPARAADFTFSLGTPGTGLAASADFTAVGGTLTIVLSNIGGDVLVPTDILTALFFNCACGDLTPSSAVLAGSTVLFGGSDPGGVVGGEWALGENLTVAPSGQKYAVTSSGFGLAPTPSNFPGSNLQGPVEVDGLQYGITSAVDNPATGNTPVTGTNALIKNSVTFTLTGYAGGPITPTTFSNIFFQYGTALDEGGLGGGSGGGGPQTLVPEPASLLLLGSGLFVAAYRARRKKQQQNAV